MGSISSNRKGGDMNTKEQLQVLGIEGPSKAHQGPSKEYYANGMSRQLAKETAMLMAIRQGYGLIRRGLEVHSIYANGESKLLCRANNLDEIWHNAHNAMQSHREEAQKRESYRILYVGHHTE